MSVNLNLAKLKNLIGVKRCIILEGNVNDIYESDQHGYVNLKAKLSEILGKTKFNDIYWWDRIDGLTGDASHLMLLDATKKKDDTYDVGQELMAQAQSSNDQKKFVTLAEFFAITRKNLLDNPRKSVFIADCTDYLFSNEQTMAENERVDLISLSKIFKDKKFDQTQINTIDSSLIFITNNVGKIPSSFYLQNPDVFTITLPKPNREERAKFIGTYKALFNIKEDLLTNKMKLEDIYDTMEGWTLKEAYQLIKYSINSNETLSFEKLINAYQYGDKISPWEEMSYNKLSTMEDELKKRVVGQDHAILTVKRVIYKAFTGLSGVQYNSRRTKPKGSLFFVGPTGVGKTELAKALAKFLFGDEKNCIRFDMSEYNQEASDQKLIGAPPGYVGYEEGGQLTNAMKEHPFCVLLFDEIEKAHPRILDKFLQILEDGRLTDNKGQTVSFSDSFIIFTSNIGSASIENIEDDKKVQAQFIKAVSDHFRFDLRRPELLGRIGNNIVPFNFIKNSSFQAQLIRLKLQPIVDAVLEKHKLKLIFQDLNNLIPIIINDSDVQKGGRDLLNSIEKHVVDGLSEFIFLNQQKLQPGQTINAVVENNRLIYLLR